MREKLRSPRQNDDSMGLERGREIFQVYPLAFWKTEQSWGSTLLPWQSFSLERDQEKGPPHLPMKPSLGDLDLQ